MDKGKRKKWGRWAGGERGRGRGRERGRRSGESWGKGRKIRGREMRQGREVKKKMSIKYYSKAVVSLIFRIYFPPTHPHESTQDHL